MKLSYEMRRKSRNLEPRGYLGRCEMKTSAKTKSGIYNALVKKAEDEFERSKRFREEFSDSPIATLENWEQRDVFMFTSNYADGLFGMAYRFALLCCYDEEFNTDACSFKFESAR